ncbi:retrovirus-related pol polyprotein from transposon TNT 1-94 [Tanacetum coccineum]
MSSECNNVKLVIRNNKSEVICAMCKKCIITSDHGVCVLNYVNGMNSCNANQSANVSNVVNQKKHKPNVRKSKKLGSKERLASPKPSKPRSCLRWSPTGRMFYLKGKLIASSESECQSDNSNGDNACTFNPHEPMIKWFLNSTSFLGRNDHVATILGYGDLQWGNILITRVYFVEGLGHNLFSIGQVCDSDLEVAFRRNTCFVKNIEGVDLLKGNRSTNLYTINLHEMAFASPICLMARATSTKSWLWHQRLSYLNFDTINDLAKNDLNDREDIGKLGAKGDIGFFIGYSANSCTYRVYNRRKKKIMETMNVTSDELSAMAFEQSSSKLGLQGMTSGQISSGLDLTYAPSTITSQKLTERELDLLFEAMYDDYIADIAPTPTNSSSQATNIPNTSHDVDELKPQQKHVQQQDNQALLQPKIVVDNVPNAMLDGNKFVNPFVPPSTSAVESSSSQYVDPSNMDMFYQPHPHKYLWTKDHLLEQVIGEPS